MCLPSSYHRAADSSLSKRRRKSIRLHSFDPTGQHCYYITIRGSCQDIFQIFYKQKAAELRSLFLLLFFDVRIGDNKSLVILRGRLFADKYDFSLNVASEEYHHKNTDQYKTARNAELYHNYAAVKLDQHV